MDVKLDVLLDWLESFEDIPFKPTYRNVIEKIWELKNPPVKDQEG